MKAVILWAGCGRRIQMEYNGLHKALIPLCGRPLLEYLLNNIRNAGFREIVPVLGYKAEDMLLAIKQVGSFDEIVPVQNVNYDRTNNLYSLLQTKEILTGEDFVVINGDMVFDGQILKDIRKIDGNVIAVDTNRYSYQLDSPRVLIHNGRIFDIGRHRSIENASGYAIGIYKFSADFSTEYFSEAGKLIMSKPEAGYHEPLEKLLYKVRIVPCETGNNVWMDVDEKADVSRAEKMLRDLEEQNE